MHTWILIALCPVSELWTIPLVALVAAGAGLFLGRYVWRRGTPAVAAAATDTVGIEAPPEHDEAYWQEKRSSPRFKVRAMRALLAESPDHADQAEGVLLNHSLGGLGLSVDRQIPAGKNLYVCLCESEEDNLWRRVEVRYCRPERGRWTLGCKFLDAPST